MLVISALFLSCLFSGCHESYDDTLLVGRLDDLEKRIAKLEAGYQEQATALQALTALKDAVDLLKTQVAQNSSDIDKNAGDIDKNAGDIDKNAGDIDKNANDIAENAQKILELIETVAKLSGGEIPALQEVQKILEDLSGDVITLDEALKALGLGIKGYTPNEATGEVTITLSDGNTITLMAKDNAIDAVKVMQENGVSYWAVGGKFLEDANGNKIPVSVTPKFKIDPDTREVSVSTDNGATWHPTGIIDEEEAPAFFTAVTADDDYIYFTLPDGRNLSVAISSAEIDVTIPVKKLYVGYGETETLEVEMANVEKYIIVKPEGWRVSLADGVLSVTAPAAGTGEAEGYVQLFTVAADGRSAIFEVKVVAGEPPVQIAVNNGAFDINVTDASLKYIYGVAVLDEDTTIESVYEANSTGWADDAVKTGTLNNISIDKTLGEEFSFDKEYVVWVIALDGTKAQPFEDMFYTTYKTTALITSSDVTGKNANVKIVIPEGKGNYILYITDAGYNMNSNLERFNTELTSTFLPSATSSSNILPAEGFNGTLSSLYNLFMWGNASSTRSKLTPDRTYFIAVVPEDNKTTENVAYGLVTLNGYSLGETTADVTFQDTTVTFTSLTVKISANTNTAFKAHHMTEETYETEYKGDNEKLMQFVSTKAEKTTNQNVSITSAVMGNSYIVVAFAYDPNTLVGKIVTHKITAPTLEYSETLELNPLTVEHTGVNYAEVEITAKKGTIKSLRYAYMTKANFEKSTTLKGDFAIAQEKLAIKTSFTCKHFDNAHLAAGNVYSIENMDKLTADQYLFVIAFDADDKPSNMVYTLVDTYKPFDLGFNVSLAKPDIKEVYYIVNTSGWTKDLSSWLKMSDIAAEDIATKLNNKNGTYWLDLDWTGKPAMKRMWFTAENAGNWNATYPITGTDMKADATSVIKKRAGATSPDFYGLNSTTGAVSLSYKVANTSEGKALRNKVSTGLEDENENLIYEYSAKTCHLVWETVDGQYGYMTVVPEDYCAKP